MDMMTSKKIWLSFISFLCIYTVHAQDGINMLTKQEVAKGWKLLFNGKDLEGWTSVGKNIPPTIGWEIKEGVLTAKKNGTVTGGDIITREEYTDFDLSVDFKLSKEGNSGIKYFFTSYAKGGWLGLEYQILDDKNHPDAKLGRNGNRLQGTLYDMLPLAKKQENSTEIWNHARIVAKGTKVTHYLNGIKILSFDRGSPSFKEAWKLSKYKDSDPPFGQVKSGHILLQDHGDEVSFRNVKIRVL
jgi:hypothetical protein